MVRFLQQAFLILCLGAALTYAVDAPAADYPSRAVRIVVPYAPGGNSDVNARILAKVLAEQTNIPFVIENKVGASGFLGAASVAQAKPDGYTLLYATDTMTSAPFLVANLPVQVQMDFTPITQVIVSPFVVIVKKQLPVSNVTELMQYAKEHLDTFSWGVGTRGSPVQLAIERLNRTVGINALQVPYTGGGTAASALLAGEYTSTLLAVSAAKPLVESGDFKGLGFTLATRSSTLPDIPTVASQGFPGFEARAWYGIWGPKEMPDSLVATIHDLVATAMKDPDLIKRVQNVGDTIAVSARPADFAALVQKDLDSNKTFIESIGIKPQ